MNCNASIPKVLTTMQLSTLYARFIGVIFLLIATTMLLIPHLNLAGDGIDFNAQTTAGKAEIRVRRTAQ